MLRDASNPARMDYLKRFADKEGRVYLSRFYTRYRGKSADEALALIASRTRPTPHRLATVFRSLRPDADQAALRRLPAPLRCPTRVSTRSDIAKLYANYGIEKFNLHDRGYIARIHPLELWLAAYLQQHPGAGRSEVMAASVGERQEVYAWLFKSKRKGVADSRIRILVEEDAFDRLHETWARARLSVPDAGALACHRHRQFGRPPGSAGRVDRRSSSTTACGCRWCGSTACTSPRRRRTRRISSARPRRANG